MRIQREPNFRNFYLKVTTPTSKGETMPKKNGRFKESRAILPDL